MLQTLKTRFIEVRSNSTVIPYAYSRRHCVDGSHCVITSSEKPEVYNVVHWSNNNETGGPSHSTTSSVQKIG